MSGREWKPGDVRLATVNGERMLVLRGRGIFEGNWYTQGPVAGSRLSVSDSWLLDSRPLLVLDPEDREQMERLTAAHCRQFDHCDDTRGEEVDAMAAAVRSLLEPPKPPEPKGLGAVVEVQSGDLYVRDKTTTTVAHWKRAEGREGGKRHPYSHLRVVRVLSEGVQP